MAIGFDVEPGEYRWSVTAIGPEFVRVQILSFPDLWSYEADTQGRLLLAFECEAWEFAAAVRDAALRVRDAWPGEAYCDKWGEHEFPTEALALLEARLGNPAAQG